MFSVNVTEKKVTLTFFGDKNDNDRSMNNDGSQCGEEGKGPFAVMDDGDKYSREVLWYK